MHNAKSFRQKIQVIRKKIKDSWFRQIVVQIILFFTCTVLVLIEKYLSFDSPYIFLIATILLILGVSYFLMPNLVENTKEDGSIDGDGFANKLSENLWIIILTIGWLIAVTSFYAEHLAEKNKPQYSLLWQFLVKKGPELCVVLLLSIVADFVVHILGFLKKIQGEIQDTRKEMLKSQTDIGNYNTKLKELVRSSETTHETLNKAIAHLHLIVAQVGTEQELHYRLIEIEKNKDKSPTCITKVADSVKRVVRIKDEGETALFGLRQRTSEVLLKYLNKDDCNIDRIVQARIASVFLDSALCSLLGGVPISTLPHVSSTDDPTTKDHEHVRDSLNFLQANYAVMSSIVDALYSSSDELYSAIQELRSDTKFKLIFFTTLTMSKFDYLHPLEIIPVPSFERQWNNVRHKTRKMVLNHTSNEPQYGHMYKFALKQDKYIFQRCCLFLGQEKSDTIGLMTKNDWEENSEQDYHLPLIKVEDAITFRKSKWNLPSSPKNSFVEGYLKQPEYVEFFEGENLPINRYTNKVKNSDIFKDLYHSTISSLSEFGLTWSDIRYWLVKQSDTMKQAFQDSDWNKLMLKAAHRVEDKEVVDTWYKIFFNRHIPLEIFAIGLVDEAKDKDCVTSNDIKWLGCVGGYIGGDFNSMLLAWHDETTGSLEKSNGNDSAEPNNRWRAIEKYMGYLWEKTNPSGYRVEENAALTDGLLFSKSDVNTWDQYWFGVTRSLSSEVLLESGDLVNELLPILDIGGGYGRDALFLAEWCKTRLNPGQTPSNQYLACVIDKEDKWKEIFESLSTHYSIKDKVEFVKGDITDAEFIDKQFSPHTYGVICSHHLLHLFNKSDLDVVISNCSKLLRNGGIMIHSFLADDCPLVSEKGETYHDLFGENVEYFSHKISYLIELLTKYGFDIDESDSIKYHYVVEAHCLWDTQKSKRTQPIVHSHRVLCVKVRKK